MLSGIKSVWQTLTNIPSLIAEKLSTFFANLGDKITGLGSFVLEGIGDIFVPDTEEMKEEFLRLIDSINPNRNTLDTEGDLFGEGAIIEGNEPTDILVDYDFGLFKIEGLKLADYSFLKQGVEYFRPVIQGFIYLMLGWYWYNQFFGIIGVLPLTIETAQKGEEHRKESANKI